MIIKRGSGRIVIIFGSFALKFCRIQSLLNIPKEFLGALIKWRWTTFPLAIKMKWQYFREGIRQNQTEYRCWKATKAPFLVPTYVGLGIVNIQQREVGQHPTGNEMDKEVVKPIGEKTNYQILCLDQHCLNPKNFLRNDRGFRIVDYGDGGGNPLTFPNFIVRYQTEIASVLCKT